MSTSGSEIGHNVQAGKLCQLRVPIGDPTVRMLFLAPEMQKAVLDGPWATNALQLRLAVELRADLERFVIGDQIAVRLGGRELLSEDMKRLLGVHEVWTYKSHAKTGAKAIRVFGRFYSPNAFVATHWQWRHVLKNFGSKEWGIETRKCISIWDSLFKIWMPHTGVAVNDYLANAKDVAIFY